MPLLCFGAGIILLALAGYCYFAPPPGAALEPGETDIELSGCTAGETREVVLRLTNHSSEPIRIIGLAGS